MKITYLSEHDTGRSGLIIHPSELQEGEEADIIEWGVHRYRYRIKVLKGIINMPNEFGDVENHPWAPLWETSHTATWGRPHTYRVQVR